MVDGGGRGCEFFGKEDDGRLGEGLAHGPVLKVRVSSRSSGLKLRLRYMNWLPAFVNTTKTSIPRLYTCLCAP